VLVVLLLDLAVDRRRRRGVARALGAGLVLPARGLLAGGVGARRHLVANAGALFLGVHRLELGLGLALDRRHLGGELDLRRLGVGLEARPLGVGDRQLGLM